MKSILSFLGDEGEGFLMTVTRVKEKDKPAFHVKVQIMKPDILEKKSTEDSIHMEVALDVLARLMSIPTTFKMEFDGFDIHTMDMDMVRHASVETDPELTKALDGLMMGGGGGDA